MRPAPPPPSTETDEPDPFKYGWRLVKRTLPSGEVDFDQVPLTLEDVLHPEEEDFHIHSGLHELDCAYLAAVFRTRPLAPPIARVTADLRIDWGVPGLRAHGPDVAVFVGLREEPNLAKGTLYLARAGGRPVLVVEVVSPETRDNDVVRKVAHYHQAGVPLYAIIDQETEEGPRWLVAHRWAPQGYQEVQLNQGRLLIPELGLYLSVQGDRAVCHDAATGQELGDYARLVRELEEADRRGQERERELEQAIEARLESDRARRLADERAADALRQAQLQSKAREEAERQKQDAERLAQQQARAREEAERLARQQAQALEEAQRRERDQTQRISEVEERVRELEEALRRLRPAPGSTGAGGEG